MTPSVFQAQMKEVQGNWPGKYNPPFLSRLWALLSANTTDDDFVAAVNILILAGGPPPAAEKFEKAIAEAKLRRNAYRGGGGSFVDVLDEAARNNKSADPDFVKACMKLYRDRYDTRRPPQERLTAEQFQQGLALLDDVARQLARPTTTKAPPKIERNRLGERDDD